MPIYKTDKKKDGLYCYRVRINYTDRSGKSHSLTRNAYGATEAKMLEAQLSQEYASGDSLIDARMTVNDLYNEYIEAKKNDVRITSLDKTMRILKLYVLGEIGEERLNKLSARMMQKWKQSVASRGLAQVTQRNIYSELHAMFNYAVRMEWIPKNPLAAVGNFKDSDFTPPKDKLHYYTPEQFVKYIAAAREVAEKGTISDWSYYVFFSIAYYMGMRKGEINALRWNDIDGNIFNIRRSLYQKVMRQTVEGLPKNKTSYRSIEAPEPLMNILNEYKDILQRNKVYREDFHVCGCDSYLPDTSIAKRNVEYATMSGLPVIRIHDFRHSHASLLANEGINIQEIARRLGHAKIEETWNTYSHLYPREADRSLSVLNHVK